MTETRKTYTRSGARRAGDDYQDIVALDLLVSMLEHPDRYECIRVEADDFGFLDDVVAQRQDGVVETKQVKFSVHPEDGDDPYTWEALIAMRKGKDGKELPSLIGKWGSSVLELLSKHDKVNAELVTNRRSAPDFSHCIDEATGHVRPEHLSLEIAAELGRQLGGSESAIRFLSNFRFRMDRPGLATWEPGIRERFLALGGTYEGWLNLKDSLRSWVREKHLPAPDGRIQLADVRRAARWRQLEALPQGFSVPADYVLPSKSLHKDVLQRLSTKTGICLVISGTPGVGKSTYLSYLHGDLQAQKRPVVRHHYFLSLGDATPGRFEHAKVIESLMADLRSDAQEALVAFEGRNSAPHEFPKWLDACSGHFSKKDFPLVIVVDGLDHVWRERGDAAELTRLFEHLLPCRPGICLVVGTQPVGDTNLPKRLLDSAPREKWVPLPALDRQAVLEWTCKNEDRLEYRRNTPPDDRDEQFREIAGAFFEISQGHPLLLRYGLNALVEAGLPVNARSIRERIPVNLGAITDYYRSLWNGLGEDGRFILCIIAASAFEWPHDGIVGCCARHGIGVLDAQRSWQQVVHMMRRVPLGWQPFHGSLGVFVTGMPEYEEVLRQVRPAVSAWLTNDAPDYWRWAYEWTAHADMGDHHALVSGTTREWVVESLAKGYPYAQVCALLGRAAKQSLVSGDFQSFAHKALLFEYVSDEYLLTNWDAKDEWTFAQLACNFVDRLPDILSGRRTELTDRQLAKLASALSSLGDEREVVAICKELIDRVNTRERIGRIDDWISDVMPIIWTESLMGSLKEDRIADRIRRNRGHIDPIRFSRGHAAALRAHRRAEVLRGLCEAKLEDKERGPFLKEGYLLALEEGADWSDIARRHSQSPYSAIYARIAHLPDFAIAEVPLPDLQALSLRAHDYFARGAVASACLDDCFHGLLAQYLWNRGEAVDEWLAEIGDHSWSRAFVQRLAGAARGLSAAILSKGTFALGDFYGSFGTLPRPRFDGDDDAHEFWRIARGVLVTIGLDSIVLTAGGSAPHIGAEDLKHSFDSAHCHWANWIRTYVERRRHWLSSDAVDWIAGEYGDNFIAGIEHRASEGVSEASVLASLMAMHGRKERSLQFLRRAVDLSITYGYHKDILLYDYVDAVELIAGCLPEAGRSEMRPVIPAILHLRDFTDGDETRQVPARLFELLVRLSPEWLPPIYRHLCREEQYYDAEAAFRRVLESLPFDSAVEIALGSTCLDKEGLERVSGKADQGCAGAKQALDSARLLLGMNPFPAKKEEDKARSSDGIPAERSVPPKASDYPPDRILDYWKAVREHSYGRGTKELAAWAEHWEGQASLSAVLGALEVLYEIDEFAEVANMIHGITVRLKGRAQAWPWLIKAHREVRGWSSHWSSKDDAVEKWELVRSYYANRWLEFVVESTAPRRSSSDAIGIHGSFPRLIEYLLLLGRQTEAVATLQGIREVTESLVSPFGVRPADWLVPGNSREEEQLDVLLSRLTWPSGMVRERACTALARLLAGGGEADRASAALVEWIRNQVLESVACLGLLPFILAKQFNAGISVPPVEALRCVCSRPSLLYEILLDQLYPKAGRRLAPGVGHAGVAPHDFKPGTKFVEQHEHALPSIYRSRASFLEKQFGVACHRQWAYEVEHTGDGLQSALVSVHFWGRADGEHYVSFDTPLSEGLRSGYLRALALLAEQGEEQHFWAIAEALRTLPVDFGLWRVSPQARPDWWPVLESPEKPNVDTVPAEVWGRLDSLLTSKKGDEWVLGMAAGRVAEGATAYDLEVFGIFQECLGPAKPEANAVWQSEPWRKVSRFLNPISPQFGGTLTPNEEPIIVRAGDWRMQPCVLAGHSYAIPRWQWWRVLRGIWLPLPDLARNASYQVACEQDRIAFRDEDGDLGFWQDWTSGVSEMQDGEITPRTGQILKLRRSAVEHFAAANRLTFCWACRISGFQEAHRFGEHERFSIHRVIGGSSLIL